MDFLHWHLDPHQQGQFPFTHIIALAGFHSFHSSFMVIDWLMEPGHVKDEEVQRRAAGQRKGFNRGRDEINR